MLGDSSEIPLAHSWTRIEMNFQARNLKYEDGQVKGPPGEFQIERGIASSGCWNLLWLRMEGSSSPYPTYTACSGT